MGRIRILPDILANKIAAGEVVERPASVVKELVENALDAESSRIRIEIENGGRSLIQVADNGIGMGHDDALMALERFATSKLHTDDDLAAISTLGFRGEALPSIAAVSKMTITTRPREAQDGVQIRINGGRIEQVVAAGAPQGTMIQVARLFFNTPARRKFLKSTATEMGHIGDTVSGMALGYPQVHFKLVHNGKTVKQWSAMNDSAERAADVMGRVAVNDLIHVAAEQGPVRLTGHLAPARMARSTARGTYLFVNGRRVRDRVIQHALFEGYRGRLMKGQYPLAVLFLELPFDAVDVNVHPTKHEIRFADQRQVHRLVQQGVSEALARAERKLWRQDTPESVQTGPAETIAEPVVTYIPAATKPQKSGGPPPRISILPDNPPQDLPVHPDVQHPTVDTAPPPLQQSLTPLKTPGRSVQQTLWQSRGFSDLTILGQFRGTYIICQDGDDLILIDQHAAHERIVYERLAKSDERVESQQLLMPETVELGFAEAQMLGQLVDGLNAMGLEIEPFGGNTFVVKSVPSLLNEQNIDRLVRELVEHSVEIGMDAGMDRLLDACRMIMACHNAIRANQRLADAQIQSMLSQLDQCDTPSHCPHGRPTWVRWTLRDVEKAFGRIV